MNGILSTLDEEYAFDVEDIKEDESTKPQCDALGVHYYNVFVKGQNHYSTVT